MISIMSHYMSLFVIGIVFKCFDWLILRKQIWSEFVSSQIWCHPISGEWMDVVKKNVLV